MSGEKLSFCVLKDDGNNEMSGKKLILCVFKDDRGDHHGGTSFFTTAGGRIGKLESKQTVVCGVHGHQHALECFHPLYNLENSRLGEETYDPQVYDK